MYLRFPFRSSCASEQSGIIIDSGASRHFSPDRSKFLNFRAIGKGDIQITLPIMAFTLISVSCVDRAGFSLFIKGGTCEIRTSSSKVIGRIPQIRGLYRVTDTKSPPRTIHSANVCKMVEKGMVIGIDLDMSSKAEFCETVTRLFPMSGDRLLQSH